VHLVPRSDGGALVYWIVPGAAAPVQGRVITSTATAIGNPFNHSLDIFYSIGPANLTAADLPNGETMLVSRNGNEVATLKVGADGQGGSSSSLTFSEVALTGGPVAETLTDGRIAYFIETSAETQASFSQPFSEMFDDLALSNGSTVSTRDAGGGFWNVIDAAGIGSSGMAIATQRSSGQVDLHIVSASTLVDTRAPIPLALGSAVLPGSFKLTETSGGNFFASWIDGTTVKAQQFNTAGDAAGQLMQVAAVAPKSASVTLLPDGGVLLLWDDRPGSDYDIFGATFTASGGADSGRFRVNSITSGDQTGPSAAVLGNGDALVVWNSSVAGHLDSVGRFVSVTRPDAENDFVGARAGHAAGYVLTRNDHDPNGDPVTLLSVGTPTKGTVTVQNGVAIYVALPGSVGRDSFTYTVQDSHGLTDTATVTVSLGPLRNDFNGDGRDDILWRDDAGQVTDWLGTGSGGFSANGALLAGVPVDWKVAGTGDFNGDRLADILWRHDGGVLTDWLGRVSGGFEANSALFASVPADWKIAGTGDFDGDGRDDILWRHDSGVVTNWLGAITGGFVANDANVLAGVPLEWKVAGTGDFNGDGKSDVLWRHDSGVVTDWLGTPNGGFAANGGTVFTPLPNEWKVAGTGDFNGDGRDDILWRSDSGQVTEWLGTPSGGFSDNWANASSSVPLDWNVADIGDFNGDGRSDILWRQFGGQLTDWLGTASGGFADNWANAAAFMVPASHVQFHGGQLF
jgi:hypothetical protein